MTRLKVCVVTGTRAEFGIWRSVLDAIRMSKRLELQLVVTGMHLQREFGYTVRDVEESGFKIAAKVPMYRKGRRASEDLAEGVKGLGAAFRKLKPGLAMVLGDRLEMLAAGSAAVAERIPLGHVHGGETAPGQWDEQIRHALTKMAHVHFCATKKAGERVVRMGEEVRKVHVVGAPALDKLNAYTKNLRGRGFGLGGVGRWVHGMVLLHPSSESEALEEKRALQLIAALRGVDISFSVVGPNNDPGHRGILRAYAKAGVPIDMSMSQESFWSHVHGSSFLIGNSSSGILEVSSMGIPVINLGNRQLGRERNDNVIDVRWESGVSGIEKAIERAVEDKFFLRRVIKRKNIYGDGHAASRIVGVLERMARGEISREKRFAD